jgi:hypothetical protein
MASFNDLRDLAQSSPVTSPLPILAGFYLDEFDIYNTVEGFHADLYDPNHVFERDIIINTEVHLPKYPRIQCEESTVKPELNKVVDWSHHEHHDRLSQELLAQSKIKNYILESIIAEEFVALVIIDGLSYETVRGTGLPMQPVFVDGITTTEPGYRRVIYGDDDVSPVSVYAELLNRKGFYSKFGFTYWDRGQEELSTDLHSSMGNSIHRISDFEEAIDTLMVEAPLTENTYVQITRMGLDQDSHNRKEEPNKSAVRDTIISDIGDLHETASLLADRFRILVTSDHGILWRDQIPDNAPVVTDEYHDHARYIQGQGNVEVGRSIRGADGSVTTGLGFPYLARELQNTEWGVHGGFSYYESIIPLIELTEDNKV